MRTYLAALAGLLALSAPGCSAQRWRRRGKGQDALRPDTPNEMEKADEPFVDGDFASLYQEATSGRMPSRKQQAQRRSPKPSQMGGGGDMAGLQELMNMTPEQMMAAMGDAGSQLEALWELPEMQEILANPALMEEIMRENPMMDMVPGMREQLEAAFASEEFKDPAKLKAAMQEGMAQFSTMMDGSGSQMAEMAQMLQGGGGAEAFQEQMLKGMAGGMEQSLGPDSTAEQRMMVEMLKRGDMEGFNEGVKDMMDTALADAEPEQRKMMEQLMSGDPEAVSEALREAMAQTTEDPAQLETARQFMLEQMRSTPELGAMLGDDAEAMINDPAQFAQMMREMPDMLGAMMGGGGGGGGGGAADLLGSMLGGQGDADAANLEALLNHAPQAPQKSLSGGEARRRRRQ